MHPKEWSILVATKREADTMARINWQLHKLHCICVIKTVPKHGKRKYYLSKETVTSC